MYQVFSNDSGELLAEGTTDAGVLPHDTCSGSAKRQWLTVVRAPRGGRRPQAAMVVGFIVTGRGGAA